MREEQSMRTTAFTARSPSDRWPFAVNDAHVKRVMPESLITFNTRLSPDPKVGPTRAETAESIAQLRLLAEAAGAPQRRLQAAYNNYREERDRDLIHTVLHCGSGADQAVTALTAALAGPLDPLPLFRRRTPPARIGQRAWAHAVYAVAAEALICQAAADWCRLGAQRARAYRIATHARVSAARQLHTRHRRAMVAIDDQGVTAQIAQLRQAEANVDRALSDLRGAIYGGGSPQPADVGRAGERTLTEELQGLSARAWALRQRMAQHSSFHAWQAETESPSEPSWPSPPRAGRRS